MTSPGEFADAILSIVWYATGQILLLCSLAYVVASRRHIAAVEALSLVLLTSAAHLVNKCVRSCLKTRVYTVLPRALFRAADFASFVLLCACVVLLITDVTRVAAIGVAAAGAGLHAVHTTCVFVFARDDLGW